MSLHGLDDVHVTQAYQGALAEAGGWFLLRYTARDAVEVLTRGAGGAAEARTAVAQYPDQSPLYGLLLYRRRKVLLKYVPDGTSRLLQARVAVHFITVSEKFAPHDVVLNISSSDELSDAALTAACTLHTAAPSSSSSSTSSTRQRKLSWIREVSEVGGPPAVNTPFAPRPPTATSIPTINESISANDDDPQRSASLASLPLEQPLAAPEQAPPTPEQTPGEQKPAPDISHITIEKVTEAPLTPESDHLRELHDTVQGYDKLFEGGPEPRASSQTTRPDYNELYEHYLAQYTKPKVKLGPRPRPSLEGKRPQTSGSGEIVLNPKSSLPSGLRSANRKQTAQKDDQKEPDSNLTIPLPPQTPTIPEIPASPISVAFSARSPASVRSMPTGGRPTGTTQDKNRLMKALELRKKQLKAQEERASKAANEDATDVTTQTEKLETDKTEDETAANKAAEAADSGEVVPTVTDGGEDSKAPLEEESSSSTKLATSGLGIAIDQNEIDDIHSAASVWSPTSAQTQGSSVAPSTRPSSVSEEEPQTTEETEKAPETQGENREDSLEGDEQHSTSSSPTVVPESRTPVDAEHPQISTDQSSSSPKNTSLKPDGLEPLQRNSTITLTPPADQANEPSPRHSKQEDEKQSKRRNRESVIVPTSNGKSWHETKDKRRALLDPITISSAERSSAEYTSDDSFMEELQNAKVEEAKPMSVSKSPVAPIHPRVSSPEKRSASQPYGKVGRISPTQLSRKSSGPWSIHSKGEPEPDSSAPVKKINVSSGISQRIKALAEKSKRDSSSSLTPPTGLDSHRLSLVSQRKSSFFAPTPTEGTSPTTRPTQRWGSPSILSLSSHTTADRRPISQSSALGPDRTVYNVQQSVEKPESVQVTARIVRTERSNTLPNDATKLDLHQSPLIIDHQKPSPPPPQSPVRERVQTPKTEPASPRAPSSSSHSREPSTTLPRSSSESSWRSFGRRMSESKSIHSHHSHEGDDDKASDSKSKKARSSKTGKLFKRMSSTISAMPWKNSSSNLALPEQNSTALASLREPPPSVHIGDLNIQFPDTLLWKRRWVEIDSMGNLVLSPSKSNEKGVAKRFHLTDFHAPYAPDQDRQELPNSVVFDFVDGRTLQCACETRTVQAHVLQVLREAHDAWLAYSQAV